MRYRVEFVCFVEVPEEGIQGEPHTEEGDPPLFGDVAAFSLAYTQVSDDEADEVWIAKAPVDEPVQRVPVEGN